MKTRLRCLEDRDHLNTACAIMLSCPLIQAIAQTVGGIQVALLDSDYATAE